MAGEREIIRYLQHLQGGHQTSTEASLTSPSIPIIHHDVYSSNPEDLPLYNGSQVRSFISSSRTPGGALRAPCCCLRRSRGGSLGVAGPVAGDRACSGESRRITGGDRWEEDGEGDGMKEPLKLYYCTPLKHRGTAASGIDRSTPDGRWKARDRAAVIVSNERNEIRFIPLRAIADEIRAMEGEGLTTIGFRKKFEYKKGGQTTKWAMMEYTLHPPESGRENRHALCYVYKTKQDGRQRNGNGNGRANERQPTNLSVGGSSISTSSITAAGWSSLSDSAAAVGESSLSDYFRN